MDLSAPGPLIEFNHPVGRTIIADSYLVFASRGQTIPGDPADEHRAGHFAHLRSYLQGVFGRWPVHVLETTVGAPRPDGRCPLPALLVAARFVSWPPHDPEVIQYLLVAWYQGDHHPLVGRTAAAELRRLDWDRIAERCSY